MSTKHLKTIVFISIGVLVFMIFGFFGTQRVQTAALMQPQHETLTETTLPVSPRVFRKPLSTPQDSLSDFQKTDFYQTIVDNRLFRPSAGDCHVPERRIACSARSSPQIENTKHR